MRIASTVLLGAFMLIGALPGAGAQPAPADKASPELVRPEEQVHSEVG